jgi:hypothetical protein
VRQSQTDQPLGQLIRCQFLTTVRVSMDATARLAFRAVNLDGFVWACPDASRRNTNAQSLRDMTLQEKIDKAAVSVIGVAGEPGLLDLRHPDTACHWTRLKMILSRAIPRSPSPPQNPSRSFCDAS